MDRSSRPVLPEPLLQAKLSPELPRSAVMPRARLTALLEEGCTRRLCLVSAPAGFGKTTLVLEWLRQSQRRFAWLSLEADDNDPARLLHYLAAALQGVDARWGQSLPEMTQPAPPPLRLALAALLDEIAANATPFVLALDDYHVITAPAIHEGLLFLLAHMPSWMHVVLLTRVDPPLAIARLRARGQMVEIRADALRFSEEEAARFLNEKMGLRLGAEVVAALTARTEGWIAGLQLAALSLRGHRDAAGFVRAFTGSHRYVLDYLVEEVLQQWPEETQDFLLQTSILERLSGALCDALTGQANGQAMLARLEEANVFLVALDFERQWYRYHQLFADMLRHRLQQQQPGLVPLLHERAALWYEQRGQLAEAVEHALRGKHWELAALLMRTASGAMLRRGRSAVLRRWLERLPRGVLESQPGLCFLYAWCLYMAGHLERCETPLRRAEAVWRAGENWARLGEALVLQGNLAVRKGDVAGARALLGEAEGYLPAENLLYRGIRCLALGRAYYLAGEVEAAGQQLAEAIGMSEAVGNVTGLLLATTFLGDVRRMEGKLHEAAVCYGEAMRIADEKRHWQVIGALIGLGQLAYEWNDLAAAQQSLERAIALGTQAERLVETSYLPAGYRALARVLWARGERQAALAALDAALALSVREQRGDLSLWIEAERSRLAWQAGARVPGEREELEAVEMQPVYAEPVALVEARWLVAAGQAPAALALLARLLAGARAAGRMGIVLEGLVVQALAEQARGARTAALRSLGEALALAEPQGYVRLFVDEGAALRALLAQGAAAGELPAYGQRLPAAMAHGRGQGAAGGAVVEPLTPREWEVARLVAAGLSNQEIAATLVISYATVKRHINSLFGKLGVQRRAQAILKLQELEG